MATVADLEKSGSIFSYDADLPVHQVTVRRMFFTKEVVAWLESSLSNIEVVFHEGKLSAVEQVDVMLFDFVVGEDFSYYERSHSMMPAENGVWELKTKDIRFFGWFPIKGTFIAAQVGSAFQCKDRGLYNGYKNEVVRIRNSLNLDEPQYIIGEYSDVL
jgi:hypothetical protein